MKPGFIYIKTRDGFTLPGLFYEPKKSSKAIIVLHGNGTSSIFYGETLNKNLSEELAKKNIALLTFNNRGAHIKKGLYVDKGRGKPKKYMYGGMAYELIKECVEDIDGAITFLKKRGYKEISLIGFSTGANKICVYNHYKKDNGVSKYVLVGGGDDTGIYYHEIGREKFFKLLKKAKTMKTKKRGDELISEIVPMIFSWKAFYDIANPDGDYNTFPFYEALRRVKLSTKSLFRYFRAIKKPSLVIYGSEDEYAWGNASRAVAVLKKNNPGLDYKIIEGGDHGLSEHTKQLSRMVANWLS